MWRVLDLGCQTASAQLASIAENTSDQITNSLLSIAPHVLSLFAICIGIYLVVSIFKHVVTKL